MATSRLPRPSATRSECSDTLRFVTEETGRRSLRAEQVAATRRALLDVARERFGAQGFAATSIDEIVCDAGVTKGALYHHFTTKEHLFDCVFDEIETELADQGMRAALKSPSDPLAALNRGFSSFLDAAMETDVQRIVLLDAPSVLGVERFDEIVRARTLGNVIAALEIARTAGVVPRVDVESLAQLLLGACTQAGMVIARSSDPKRSRRVVGKTLKALIDGLAA